MRQTDGQNGVLKSRSIRTKDCLQKPFYPYKVCLESLMNGRGMKICIQMPKDSFDRQAFSFLLRCIQSATCWRYIFIYTRSLRGSFVCSVIGIEHFSIAESSRFFNFFMMASLKWPAQQDEQCRRRGLVAYARSAPRDLSVLSMVTGQ